MVKDLKSQLADLNEVLEKYEKRLTKEKIGDLRTKIRNARSDIEADRSGYIIGFRGKSALVKGENYQKLYQDKKVGLRETANKLIVADDYAKKDRLGEAYVLLGSAVKNLDPEEGSSREKITGKDVYELLEAMERRAIRYAKRAQSNDIELARGFAELAGACEHKKSNYPK